jgi:nondiscriminating glutamyl-tRNA synthetase
MTIETPRVRFAPSPTGLLHVGNARTALYNWLYARRHGGVFILRIEDTDMERSEARHEKQLIEDLHWLGLDWDEGPGGTAKAGSVWEDARGAYGPYRQSERLDIYAKYTEKLLNEGKAYPCFCTPEDLEAQRQAAAAEHKPQVYSGRCRYLTQAEVDENLNADKPFAVRLKIEDHPLKFHDLVRGDVEFAAEAVSDPVLVRSAHGGASGMSEGVPVYNYVVTVDDALMEITHVIRGDDHISNTPKQVAIYESFGWEVPEFAHLSTILGADRERLSKRHGATSIATFREMGYLPEALVNYLALLGWGAEDGKTETFTLDELTKAFSLERVTPSPAVFDFDKLNWLNRHYLKLADPARVATLAWPYFAALLPARLRASTAEVSGVTAAPEEDESAHQTEEMLGVEGTGFRTDSGEAEPSGITVPDGISPAVLAWFGRVVELFVPAIDHLDQLPAKAAPIFGFDPAAARADQENAAVLAADSAHTVLTQLANRIRAHSGAITPGIFKEWLDEIKVATGVKGKELFHPVRIALTGFHSGREFEKVIPLIEEGMELGLVPSVRERIERFVGVSNA